MIGSGGFGGDNRHTQPMAEINTTPMVDVMLVLLVIFIITAPLLTHSIKIDLPQAGSQANPEKPDTVTLSIDAEGKLFWNDALFEQEELALRLETAAQKKPQPELHLRADKATNYQQLAMVMSAAQTVGIEKLGFVTEPKSKE
ncbi:MAG: biopolymer transporter ExbD [Methylobacter tundripaludum]|jgi:biopolymer transport protein ExbD|uniref:Outer membrane transport energization protein ExbD n=1 Tax=Methylobacter tundripaludum TaxID=173365 RepID=A0A2S6H6L1_9GAMM|nr:biopolymer transporter ExbD [Methylobacter tundripaludum]MCK9636385.1 biopolymer transporter ExbD [Methylobacter tundripaludum]PPK73107.1 outer membrane transport energization protein ExbD [Methylobacter tundripaludum]